MLTVVKSVFSSGLGIFLSFLFWQSDLDSAPVLPAQAALLMFVVLGTDLEPTERKDE